MPSGGHLVVRFTCLVALLLVPCLPSDAASAGPTPAKDRSTLTLLEPTSGVIRVWLDARESPRKILHARLRIPVATGPVTLLYPKWIPGEHGPTGPVVNLSGLDIRAGRERVAWTRDPSHMYAIHCEVPPNAPVLDVELDVLLPAGTEGFSGAASSTEHLAVVSWNQALLYPAGRDLSSLTCQATLRLPRGWRWASALQAEHDDEDTVAFAPVPLATLVDSPVLIGDHVRVIALSAAGDARPVRVHLAADSEAALDAPPELITQYGRLVKEADALFGARHYRHYDFLVTLSDSVAHFGLEHHESSDDRIRERSLVEEEPRMLAAGLLPHEYVHSWNGKYRRPADIATPDFQQPMQTALLWVYEGLTTHLGDVLTARSGLLTPEQYRDDLALSAAYLEHTPGRRWRPLVDTTVAAQLLYEASDTWGALRRGVDFYAEGELIWLEADSVIRRETRGRRSLDDFCRSFFGGESGDPQVRPYTLDDVIAALDAVASHDWAGFFAERVDRPAERPPLGGITAGGWKLTYTDQPNKALKAHEERDEATDLTFSLGFRVGKEGAIPDVVPDMPAADAGLAPGMKLVAVNGRQWSKDVLNDALKAGVKNHAPLELLVQNGEFYRTISMDYHGGPRYPHLVRDESVPDTLSKVIAPRVTPPRPPRAARSGAAHRERSQKGAAIGR